MTATDKKIPAAIVGASGYVGLELARLLSSHPGLELSRCYCRVPRAWEEVAPHLERLPALEPLSAIRTERVMFFCLPHGETAPVVAEHHSRAELLVDLSADFRLDDPKDYEKFYGFSHPAPALLKQAVYGLAEQAANLSETKLLAVAGCYPTACLLPLLPLLREGAISPEGIVINAISGLSGAGRGVKAELMFCENAESVRAYGVGGHRHLAEIEQELGKAAGRESLKVVFTPHLAPMKRGLYATITAVKSGRGHPAEILREAYRGSDFVRLWPRPPATAHVLGSNRCHIHLTDLGDRLVLTSAIDNLIKGAAGQAVQLTNLKLGLAESAGLERP